MQIGFSRLRTPLALSFEGSSVRNIFQTRHLNRAWVFFLLASFVYGFAWQPQPLTIVVTDKSTTQAVSGATVRLISKNLVWETNQTGSIALTLEPGNYLLEVFANGYQTEQRTVVVGKTAPEKIVFSLQPSSASIGEELVVLGSRFQRTATETPVPVDVVSSSDIAQTGMTETSRALQFLAPSFNHSTSTISDGTDIVRPSTLRGLGPDQTLVLVNGKRRHNSALVHVNGSVGRGTAGTDLNAIPLSAIKRIEVLRDGAAAQYGSDAIAGVINIELNDSVGQTQVGVNTGQMTEGDGETVQAFASHGFALGSKGVLHLSAEYRDRGFTDRSGIDPRQQYPTTSEGTPDPRESSFNRDNHRYGDAASENGYLWLNGHLPIAQTKLYFFGGYSQRDGESAGFYRRALDNRNLPTIYPDGFLPLIKTDVEDVSFSTGLEGFLGDVHYDVSLTSGENSFGFFIDNSLNVSLGPNSPTSADAGRLEFGQTTFNADFFYGLTDNLSLAFGMEARQDKYAIEAGEPASYIDGGFPNQSGGVAAPGIQVFPGFRPGNQVDETRDNIGLYTDLEWQTERSLVGTALRFEDYSDFGNKLSGKIAARHKLSTDWTLRGSFSTGFRAPSLHQSFFNNTSTQFVIDENTGQLAPLEVGTFRQGSEVANALGIPKLEAETSTHFSAGITFKPNQHWSITSDFYGIDIDDRIVISGQFSAASDPAIAAILRPFNVNAAQFFTNAIDTRTRGMDLVVGHVRQLQSDTRVKFTFALNKNETKVVGQVNTPAPLTGFGEVLFNRIERERLQSAQPRTLWNFGTSLEKNRFVAAFKANYFGSVKTVESASNPATDQVFGGKIISDLELNYTFSNGLAWSIGGNNLFNTYPDRNNNAISFNGIFVYPRRTAPFGFNGSYYYTRLKYSF